MARTLKKPIDQPAAVPVNAIWPLDQILPYGRNARKIPQLAVDKVKASIKEFGPTNPILVNAKGSILAGHTRREAAYQLGLKEFPVRVFAYLTVTQERALRLADNRTGEETEWDEKMLAEELADLLPDLADPSVMGFEKDELTDILTPSGAAGRSTPGGEPGEKDFSRSDGVYVEIFLTPAAYERHRATLSRWAALKDVDINFPE